MVPTPGFLSGEFHGWRGLACCSPWWSQRVGPELATEQHVFYKPYDFRFLSFLLLAILPIASSCCTEVSHHISRRLLERVTTCRIQRADGDCDLAAVMWVLFGRRAKPAEWPFLHQWTIGWGDSACYPTYRPLFEQEQGEWCECTLCQYQDVQSPMLALRTLHCSDAVKVKRF